MLNHCKPPRVGGGVRLGGLVAVLLLPGLATTAVAAQQPSLREADRLRLAEAFRLADEVREGIWPGWSEVPFAVLLVTPEQEFLVRHPAPSDEFAVVTERDALLGSAVHVRERQFAPNLLATFPAVGGVSTVVVGQPENTGRSSTEWVVTLLHEHFHQLQNTQPDYFEAVAALDLSGGDETGMWMLNYPFPYQEPAVGERFAAYRLALRDALERLDGGEDSQRDLGAVLAARARLRNEVDDADYRYFSFQLWQEGVARFTELRVAEAAAEAAASGRGPLPAFSALADVVPYQQVAEALRRDLVEELTALDLAASGRLVFYSVGAAEALLLDAVRPGWRSRYLREKFQLERLYDEQ